MSVVDPTIDEAYELLTNTLNHMADAIRIKTGTVGDIDAPDFADEISNITPGGSMDYSDYDGFNYLIKSLNGNIGITKALYNQYIYPIVSDKTTYTNVCFILATLDNVPYLIFMYVRNGGSVDYSGVRTDYYYTQRSYLRYYPADTTDSSMIDVINLKKVGTDIDTYDSQQTLYRNSSGCQYNYYMRLISKFDYTHLYR